MSRREAFINGKDILVIIVHMVRIRAILEKELASLKITVKSSILCLISKYVDIILGNLLVINPVHARRNHTPRPVQLKRVSVFLECSHPNRPGISVHLRVQHCEFGS